MATATYTITHIDPDDETQSEILTIAFTAADGPFSEDIFRNTSPLIDALIRHLDSSVTHGFHTAEGVPLQGTTEPTQ